MVLQRARCCRAGMFGKVRKSRGGTQGCVHGKRRLTPPQCPPHRNQSCFGAGLRTRERGIHRSAVGRGDGVHPAHGRGAACLLSRRLPVRWHSGGCRGTARLPLRGQRRNGARAVRRRAVGPDRRGPSWRRHRLPVSTHWQRAVGSPRSARSLRDRRGGRCGGVGPRPDRVCGRRHASRDPCGVGAGDPRRRHLATRCVARCGDQSRSSPLPDSMPASMPVSKSRPAPSLSSRPAWAAGSEAIIVVVQGDAAGR